MPSFRSHQMTLPVNTEELFHTLNKEFFRGQLPDYRIEFVAVSVLRPDRDEGGQHLGLERKILLTEPLRHKPEELRKMLIHEMVHAETGDEHDERFFDKLIDIARTGESWAWEEAREYHPCNVKTMIHLWRKSHPSLKISNDPRTRCLCRACTKWRDRGCPASESLESWSPWATSDAPPHIRQPLPDPAGSQSDFHLSAQGVAY
jgi:hypothetical protein